MNKALHDTVYRLFITNKNFKDNFERIIRTLLAKSSGCSPYRYFCAELESLCRLKNIPHIHPRERQQIFCALAEWYFIGLSSEIIGICNIEYDWEFWEKIGRRLKAGGNATGNFYTTERIFSSTEVKTIMDDYTHGQFYLALINDRPAYEIAKRLVSNCEPLSEWLDNYCSKLADQLGMKSLSVKQRFELRKALVEHFRSPATNRPSQRLPSEPTATNPCGEISTPTKDKATMNNNIPAFQTKHFVDGVDATTLSDDQLINTIKRLELEIKTLAEIKSSSKKITAKVTELDLQRKAVVDLLDARMP